MKREGIRAWFHQARINFRTVNPYEVGIALAVFILGVGLILMVPDPISINAVFPDVIRAFWGALVALGGFLKLWGLATNSIPLRKAGLILITGICWTFVLAIVSSGLATSFFTGGIFVSIAVSSMVMYRRL